MNKAVGLPAGKACAAINFVVVVEQSSVQAQPGG